MARRATRVSWSRRGSATLTKSPRMFPGDRFLHFDADRFSEPDALAGRMRNSWSPPRHPGPKPDAPAWRRTGERSLAAIPGTSVRVAACSGRVRSRPRPRALRGSIARMSLACAAVDGAGSQSTGAPDPVQRRSRRGSPCATPVASSAVQPAAADRARVDDRPRCDAASRSPAARRSRPQGCVMDRAFGRCASVASSDRPPHEASQSIPREVGGLARSNPACGSATCRFRTGPSGWCPGARTGHCRAVCDIRPSSGAPLGRMMGTG